MPKCICHRCFFCINLRVGCSILGSILLLLKLYETMASSIIAIDLTSKSAQKKLGPSHNSELTSASAVAVFHFTVLMIVCVLLEGLRKAEPKRLLGFIYGTLVAYTFYIPVFIYMVAKYNSAYTQSDWTMMGFRIGVIAYYVYVILMARSYHHQLTSKTPSNTNIIYGQSHV